MDQNWKIIPLKKKGNSPPGIGIGTATNGKWIATICDEKAWTATRIGRFEWYDQKTGS